MSKRTHEEQPGTDHGAPPTSTAYKLLIPNTVVSTIIGKAGVNIKAIREKSACKVLITDLSPGANERLVTLTGSLESAISAVELILDTLETDPQATAMATDEATVHSLKCLVSDNQVGRIIGKAGASIKQLRTETGASIATDSNHTADGERAVTVGGVKASVVAALLHIMNTVASMPPDRAAKRQALEPSAMLMAGGAPTYGAPPGYGAPSAYHMPGYAPPTYQMPTYAAQSAQSAYHQMPAYVAALPPSRFSIPSTFDSMTQPGYPGQRAPAAAAKFAPPQPLSADQQAVRVAVANEQVSTIIGKGGANIKAVRMQSSCRVFVADMVPGSNERVITLTGTTAAIIAAAELMLGVLDQVPQSTRTRHS